MFIWMIAPKISFSFLFFLAVFFSFSVMILSMLAGHFRATFTPFLCHFLATFHDFPITILRTFSQVVLTQCLDYKSRILHIFQLPMCLLGQELGTYIDIGPFFPSPSWWRSFNFYCLRHMLVFIKQTFMGLFIFSSINGTSNGYPSSHSPFITTWHSLSSFYCTFTPLIITWA